MSSAPAIGIDLGTSYSSVAVFQNGKVEILANNHGNTKTPSYVAFPGTERLVGDDAKGQMRRNPMDTIFGAKRLVGQKYENSLDQSAMKQWPFNVAINVLDRHQFSVVDRNTRKIVSCEEVLAMLLANLKDTAETHLGIKVRDAVISVPVSFNNAQRQAILDAGSIAGLNVLGIINEPTAAVIAYSAQSQCNYKIGNGKNILVVNVGGGYTDVCIANIDKEFISIKSNSGDNNLGGEDFDGRLVSHFVNEFLVHHKKELTTSKRALARLRDTCEQAKISLSTSEKASIELENLYEEIDYSTFITRDRFEELNSDLFRRIIEVVKKALSQAMLNPSEIHDVILVGGSTRIPKIQQLLQNLFVGQSLTKTLNPDESVVYGAAIHAAILQGNQDVRNLPLLLGDLTSFPLTAELNEGTCLVFKRNTMYPKSDTQAFTTCKDDQTNVWMKVYEGEGPLNKDSNVIGALQLKPIPEAPKGVPVIMITFDIDANGMFKIAMLKISCGGKVTTKVAVKNEKAGFDKAQIEEMKTRLEEYRLEDKKRLEKAIQPKKKDKGKRFFSSVMKVLSNRK